MSVQASSDEIAWRGQICTACGAIILVGIDARRSGGSMAIPRCPAVNHDWIECGGLLRELAAGEIDHLFDALVSQESSWRIESRPAKPESR